ncbi:MAG: chain-length determining protein [Desulfobacteraceae bacterium]|nr:chain-length determining protein [Desulfobacteraceae bacterium]
MGNVSEHRQAALSLKDYITILKRRKRTFIIPVIIALVMACVLAIMLPATYKSSATILIEEQEIPSDFVSATVTSYAEQRIEQINQRIMSTNRLSKIIEQFDLYHDIRQSLATEEIVERMRDAVNLRQISAEVVDRRTGRPTTATIAFELSFMGREIPDTVQRVTNTLVSLYLRENLEVRERQSSETTKFLKDEIERVKKDLLKVEEDLSKFKGKHVNALPELMQANTQSLSYVERNIERAQEQLRSLQERKSTLQAELSSVSPYEGTSNNELEIMENQLAELRSKFSDKHPDVINKYHAVEALKKRLESQKGQETAEHASNPAYVTLSSELSGVKSQIKSMNNQITSLNKEREKYEKRIQETPAVEQEYNNLVSDQRHKKAKMSDLTQKYMDAKVAYGLEKGRKGERFTLIDPPRVPKKPFKPNRLAILIIGVMLGLGVGSGLTLLKEFMDDSIRDAEMLIDSTGIPVLGTIPTIITPQDKRRLKVKRKITAFCVCLVLIIGVIVFHFLVMDLSVLWAKIERKFMI